MGESARRLLAVSPTKEKSYRSPLPARMVNFRLRIHAKRARGGPQFNGVGHRGSTRECSKRPNSRRLQSLQGGSEMSLEIRLFTYEVDPAYSSRRRG